ncbi:MAG: sensor histidine kinase [Candidatus Hodarchaeales archaeon]|jgi:signal transduction histidine kinase
MQYVAQEMTIISLFVFTIIFFISTYLVLHESVNQVNLSFAFATITFGIATFLGFLGALASSQGYNQETILFFQIGTVCLLLAPSGLFFSAKLILYGTNGFYQISSIIWSTVTFFSSLGVLMIYPSLEIITNNSIWDIFIVILLIGVFYQYYKIYELKTEWQSKISFILFGLLISIFGLSLNIITIFITRESTILRTGIPLIGQLIIVAAFVVIPESQRKVQDWKQLQIENEQMQLLLDLITHDLTNYLMTSNGYLEIAMDEINNDSIKNTLSLSKSGSLRAKDLLNTVSTLMKTKLDYDYQLQPISIKKAIKRTEKIILQIYPSRQIEIIINQDHDIILADSLFDQLMLNLFTNAVKNDSQKKILINIAIKNINNNKVIISICDHGKGIAPTEREKILDRYAQFKKNGIGSGLGLFIIKTLTKRYRGKISIENTNSEDYTKGTCFVFEFPYCYNK